MINDITYVDRDRESGICIALTKNIMQKGKYYICMQR